jgi:hypothetical protein
VDAPSSPVAAWSRPARWPWPAPALGAWLAAAAVHAAVLQLPVPALPALLASLVVPAAVAARTAGLLRRALVLGGFPLALSLTGSASLPAWAWLIPVALLLALYPVQAWRDAPLYPTGERALHGLAAALALPAAPRILDAGCGLGHGLAALGGQWPGASLTGLERSRVLAWLARRRCPRARVLRGDMWRHDWSAYDLVYLFQRPESMGPAWHKARREMPPGSWLVSLDFPVEGVSPQLSLQQPGERAVFAYRLGGHPARRAA